MKHHPMSPATAPTRINPILPGCWSRTCIDVSNILKQKFNYETGPYQGFTHDQTNYKWLAKIDWNINMVHKLSFTYNGLDATKDKPAHPSAIGRRGPDYTTLQFRNSGYEIVNKLNSFGSELRSNLERKFCQ